MRSWPAVALMQFVSTIFLVIFVVSAGISSNGADLQANLGLSLNFTLWIALGESNEFVFSTAIFGYVASIAVHAIRQHRLHVLQQISLALSLLACVGYLNEAFRLVFHHDLRVLVSIPIAVAVLVWISFVQARRDQPEGDAVPSA